MKWWERLSALSVAVLLMAGAAVALERENTDGASAAAAAGLILLGMWAAAELHDRWRDDDRHRGGDDR